jgi:autotransporter-associated beta strand protein
MVSGTSTISAQITESSAGKGITQINNSALVLTNDANSFTGIIKSQNAGSISVSSIKNSGVASAAGAGTTVELGSGSSTSPGTLIYTGSGDSTNRTFSLTSNTGNATANLTNNGTGALVITGAINNVSSTGTKTLTLGGSYAGSANQITSAIADTTTSGGKLGITKVGVGTWLLTGANTFTGATLVSAGTLLVDGSLAAGSAVTVSSAALLGGTGTVGTATVSGGITPGTVGTIGTFSAAALTCNSGTHFKFDLSTTDNTSDRLAITGAFTKGTGNAGTFIFDFNGTGMADQTYTLATFGSVAGGLENASFASTNLGSGLSGIFTLTSNKLTFTTSALTAGTGIRGVDFNSDGLDDVWQYFFLTDGLTPVGDADSDSQTNQAESIAGTDPRNPASFFHISKTLWSGENLVLTWTSNPGKSYRVMGSENLATGELDSRSHGYGQRDANRGECAGGAKQQSVFPRRGGGCRFRWRRTLRLGRVAIGGL